MKVDPSDRVNNADASSSLSNGRLAYANPRLLVYGALRDLTAAGSNGTPEGVMMTALMRHA